MKLSTQELAHLFVVRAEMDRIDAAVAIQFKDAMRQSIPESTSRAVLDLSKVSFIDSSGLGAIVAAMKQMGTERKLDLAGLTPTVDKVFKLTRMDSVFVIHPTIDEAVKKYAAA